MIPSEGWETEMLVETRQLIEKPHQTDDICDGNFYILTHPVIPLLVFQSLESHSIISVAVVECN